MIKQDCSVSVLHFTGVHAWGVAPAAEIRMDLNCIET